VQDRLIELTLLQYR